MWVGDPEENDERFEEAFKFWYEGNPEHAAEQGANFIGGGTIEQLPGVVARYL